MMPQEKNMQEYAELQYKYLAEAEEMFGPRTDYQYIGLFYHNFAPRVIMHDHDFLTGEYFYKIELCGKAINDRTDGILQLSHEVIHLLSPVEQDGDNVANYLEEGIATYFSQIITERDTRDYAICPAALASRPNYLRAYELYKFLIAIDNNAVKKLREITPVIAHIKPEDFVQAGLQVGSELIYELLRKFEQH